MKASPNTTLYLVSNMYPSPKNIRYGIFVENFEKAIGDHYHIKKIVLTKQYNPLSKLTGYISLYFRIFLLIFKKKDQLIYVHFPLHMAPVLWFVSWFNQKMILNFHGSDLLFDSIFKKALSLFLKPLIKSSYVVVPSHYYREMVLKNFNCNNSDILVYPSGGINTQVFKEQIKKPKKEFTIGFVSNLIKEKGWEIFLQALVLVKKEKEIPFFNVLMVGDGPDKDDVEHFIAKHKLDVKLYSNLNQVQLADIYNEMSLFVFPSYRKAESLGLVGLEAMACGVPVIASKVGGPMGYIEDGVNGYLFDKKDANMLAKKISFYYQLSEKTKQMLKSNAIAKSLEYDSHIVARQLLNFLDKL